MHQKISTKAPLSPLSRDLPSLAGASPVWDSIHGTLGELGFSPEAIPLVTPKVYPELSGKRVLMVDDDRVMLGCFVADLMAATMGRATFLYCGGLSFEALCSRIGGIRPEPDIILMDSAISAEGNFYGHDVVKALRLVFKNSVILGFSTATAEVEKFEAAGADGFIVKRPAEPWASVGEIAEFMGLIRPRISAHQQKIP